MTIDVPLHEDFALGRQEDARRTDAERGVEAAQESARDPDGRAAVDKRQKFFHT
jgi:hypothetical protein